nr:ankyrin repeat-containing domain, PGG domain protein [Tanacetum cinerariifolium]
MSQTVQDPSNHPHENESPATSTSLPQKLSQKLPLSDLIDFMPHNNRKQHGGTAKEAILDENKNLQLLKCSITENGETALHVAASANGPKKVEQFVTNLVAVMEKEDLELVNNNHNTALYLAAMAGNIETVKIMVEKNRALLTIPGAGGNMMPLYAAALFGNDEVVRR